jgi:N-acetylneuraminate epimerase
MTHKGLFHPPRMLSYCAAAVRRTETRNTKSTRDNGTRFIRMALSVAIVLVTANVTAAELSLEWRQLPSLPDPNGFAGAFAGTSGGALIVAGGANFPDKPPWENGRKVWYDNAFVLERTNAQWRSASKLPRPLGYGVSVTTLDGVLCIGGSDATQHVPDVFLLRWQRGELKSEALAPLPEPLANSCGAVVGQTIYIAGGTATPDATHALKNFWSLDFSSPRAAWKRLDLWPGSPRMLAVAASVGGSFYVVGGADLAPNANGQPVRTYLKDAYRFTPGKGWKRIADMPNSIVAAPTPAPVFSHGFLVIGGDDGSLVNFEPKANHPGFPKRIFGYDMNTDRWSALGEAPISRATLPAVAWGNLFVFPSGEVKPGVRSPQVWAMEVRETR